MNINKIILGTAQLNSKYGISNYSLNKKKKIFNFLDFAIDNGINKIETAPGYNNEKIIGNFLENYKYSRKIEITTKISSLTQSKNKFDRIYKSINKSQYNLRYQINTIMLHSADDTNFLIKNFLKFKEIKKIFNIKNLGISIYDTSQFKKFKNFSQKITIQLPTNIINDKFLKYEFQKNFNIQGRSIFLQGLLLNKKVKLKLSKKNKFKHLKYFNYLKKNNIDPLEICMSIMRHRRINNYVLGFDDKKQLSAFLKNKLSNRNYSDHLKNIKKIFKNSFLDDPRKWNYNFNI